MKLRPVIAVIFCLALNLGVVFADSAAEKATVAAAQSWLGEIDSGNYRNELEAGFELFSGSGDGKELDGCFEWHPEAARKATLPKNRQNPECYISSRGTRRELSGYAVRYQFREQEERGRNRDFHARKGRKLASCRLLYQVVSR